MNWNNGGEVKPLRETGGLTSPAAPISLGSVTLFDRRGRPSSKEGIRPLFQFVHASYDHRLRIE